MLFHFSSCAPRCAENTAATMKAANDTTKRLHIAETSLFRLNPITTDFLPSTPREAICRNRDVRAHVRQSKHRAPIEPRARPCERDANAVYRTIVAVVILGDNASDRRVGVARQAGEESRLGVEVQRHQRSD